MQTANRPATESGGIEHSGEPSRSGNRPLQAASVMQQLQAPALPLDRINTMRAELARFDDARIDNATLHAILAHVSAPTTVYNGANTLPTHSAALSVAAALQPPAPAQKVSIKVEEQPPPVPRKQRDQFRPHFPEKPKAAVDGLGQGAAEPDHAADGTFLGFTLSTKPRSQQPVRRRRDMSAFAAQFLGRGRKGTKRPPKGPATPPARQGLEDTQPSMDEKEVAQLLLELNPTRNGVAACGHYMRTRSRDALSRRTSYPDYTHAVHPLVTATPPITGVSAALSTCPGLHARASWACPHAVGCDCEHRGGAPRSWNAAGVPCRPGAHQCKPI